MEVINQAMSRNWPESFRLKLGPFLAIPVGLGGPETVDRSLLGHVSIIPVWNKPLNMETSLS